LEEKKSKSTHLERELLRTTVEHDFARFLRSADRPEASKAFRSRKISETLPNFSNYFACRLTGEPLSGHVVRPAHLIGLRRKNFWRAGKSGEKLNKGSEHRLNFGIGDLDWLEAAVRGTFTIGDPELLWHLLYAVRETTNVLVRLSKKVHAINLKEISGSEMKRRVKNFESRLGFLCKLTELVERFEETRGKDRINDIFSFFVQIERDQSAMENLKFQVPEKASLSQAQSE